MADLKSLLWPQTVALIGASNDADGLRGRILHVMKSHAFAGNFYPVSRSRTEVMGLKAYPSIDALPHPADLAVLIIPAQYVPAELERCGKAGVKSAIILSSGFAEAVGGEGSSLQDEIRTVARRYGMAVMGPNSEGYANTAALLCPTFSPAMEASARPLLPERSPRGQVAVIAQSGGIGFSYFDHGRAKEMSFRYIVTTGNEACLETLDFADFIVDEGKTDALMLLLEDVKNPRMFRKVAEKALRAGVPIIVNKIGQSEAGVRAAASHTAALAGSYDAYRAMFARYGMIEGRDTGEMVDIADGFVAWKHCLPAGRRVAICTASGGGGGWMADACAAAGLDVPELDAGTRARVDVHLPSYGTSQNPVDATAQGVYKIGYAGLLDLVLPSPAIDGVIVVMTARSPANIERQREALERLARETEKPILLWTYTLPAPASVSLLAAAGYPLFTNIQNCARTFRALADYKAMRERFLRPITVRNEPAPETARARDLLAAAGTTLCEWEARPILEAYGLRWGPAGVLATSADDAVRAAREIGGPVALKVQSPGLPHKTEAGAVALNLSSPDEVRAAYARVLDGAKHHAPAADILGVLVQPMAPPGHEVILGIKRDATFGPMLMVGLGGVLVELLQDVALAPVPLDERQARDLIESLKGARLLRGYRGTPPADVGALATLMAQLSRLAAEHVEDITEIDLNPVLVHEQGRGVTVVDALIVKSAS
jgi:acyl-CoA synthetase (NDP forming)